jgi:hypothetical protein
VRSCCWGAVGEKLLVQSCFEELWGADGEELLWGADGEELLSGSCW